jgi:hypothetical protein
MKYALLVAALLATALSACAKKDESAAAAQPAPAVAPAATPAPQADAAPAPILPANTQATGEQAPAADSKPAN